MLLRMVIDANTRMWSWFTTRVAVSMLSLIFPTITTSKVDWEVGVGLEGPWKVISYDELPKGLRTEKKGKGKAKAKGKSKGHPGRGLGLDKE
jgi:hypothetical protein